MHDVGFKAITSIDLSDVAINGMKKQHAQIRPDLIFEKMDVTKMDYDNDSFNVVLDKGTLDAMMTDDSSDVKETIDKMFSVRFYATHTCTGKCLFK